METSDIKSKVYQTHREGWEDWRTFIALMDKDVDAKDFEDYMKELGFDIKYGRKPENNKP